MFFSSKVSEEWVAAIKNIFHLNIVSRHEKYLRLPSMVGRKKSSFCNELNLRVLNKVSNWQHKLFSSGGKEVLIKVVPAYTMSVFKIPIGLCNDIQRAIARFWWGSKEDKRGIHWATWERMSCAKSRGGVGFKDMSSFNQALIAKQGWRLIQYPVSLMAKVMKARYFKQTDFLKAKVGYNPSFI